MSHPRVKVLVAAVAASSALLLFLPGAGAAPAAGDQYRAEAVASALQLSVFGQSVAIGKASTTADSTPSATATGAGALLATQSVGATQATATSVGQQSGSAVPTCGPLALPTAVPLLSLSSACSSSQAAVTDAGPSSKAVGQSVKVGLTGNSALAPVAGLTTQVTDQLLAGLRPLLGQAPIPVPTEVVVDQLTKLLNQAITNDGVSLLTVTGGDATATSSGSAATADAATEAGGITVKVLDRSALGLAPILTLEVGTSTTSVSRTRATGETTANASAIPVRVTVAPDVAAVLQLPQSSFDAPEGQRIDLPLPAPLTSSITLSAGRTSQVDGGMKAEAASVALDLLQGLNGGIQVGLSAGSSTVTGSVPAATPPPPAAPPAPPAAPAGPGVALKSLPRTGVEQGTLTTWTLGLLAAALGTGGLVLASARRSRSARG